MTATNSCMKAGGAAIAWLCAVSVVFAAYSVNVLTSLADFLHRVLSFVLFWESSLNFLLS